MQAQVVMKAINVLVCDDSSFMRVTLRHIIASDPVLRVIDIARNGEEASKRGGVQYIVPNWAIAERIVKAVAGNHSLQA